jgi:hypothetical protein
MTEASRILAAGHRAPVVSLFLLLGLFTLLVLGTSGLGGFVA